MKTKFYLLAVVALLALVLSACGSATSQEALRTVSVTGAGQAYLVPDIAYIYVGVHTEKPSASGAMAENNAQTQKMIQALTDFGIDAKDIRTTNFSIWPQDKYDPQTGLPTGQKTYTVDNTVYVTVRDLKKLGDLLDTVVAAGANTVNSIQFDVADKEAAIKSARAEAVNRQVEHGSRSRALRRPDWGVVAHGARVWRSGDDARGRGGGGGGLWDSGGHDPDCRVGHRARDGARRGCAGLRRPRHRTRRFEHQRPHTASFGFAFAWRCRTSRGFT